MTRSSPRASRCPSGRPYEPRLEVGGHLFGSGGDRIAETLARGGVERGVGARMEAWSDAHGLQLREERSIRWRRWELLQHVAERVEEVERVGTYGRTRNYELGALRTMRFGCGGV